MFQVLLGAVALLGIGKMGIDAVKDVVSSVNENGVKATAAEGAKNAASCIQKNLEKAADEYEKSK